MFQVLFTSSTTPKKFQPPSKSAYSDFFSNSMYTHQKKPSISYFFATSYNFSKVKSCTRLTLSGKELDDNIGIYYFGARYYDADLRLWISPDPARQYPSSYTYCGNNPLSCIDKDGRWGSPIDYGPVPPGEFVNQMADARGSTAVLIFAGVVLAPGLAIVGTEALGAWAFGTAADIAVFYSGGAGAQAAATTFAAGAGKKTIEMTRGGGFLNNLRLYDKSVPVARRVWDVASGFFARNASGVANTFTKAAKPEGTFSRIEKAILEASKQAGKVTEIIEH